MSLPFSRDYNAVDTGPLPHTTVNALQDAVVNGSHGLIETSYSLIPGYSTNGAGAVKDAVSPHSWGSSGGNDWVDRWFELPVGTVVVEAYLNCYQGESGSPITWEIQELNNNQIDSVVMFSAGNTTTGAKQLPSTVSWIVKAGKVYRFRAKSNTSVAGDSFDFFVLKTTK